MPMIPVDVDSSTVAATSAISAAVTFGFCVAMDLRPGPSLAIATGVGIALYSFGIIPIGLLVAVGIAMTIAIFKKLVGNSDGRTSEAMNLSSHQPSSLSGALSAKANSSSQTAFSEYKIGPILEAMQKPLNLSTPEQRVFSLFNIFMLASTEGIAPQALDMKKQMVVCTFTAGALEGAWELLSNVVSEKADSTKVLEVLVRYLLNTLNLPLACVVSFVENAEDLLQSDGGRQLAAAGKSSLARCLNVYFSDGMQNALASAQNDISAMSAGTPDSNAEIQAAIGALRDLLR